MKLIIIKNDIHISSSCSPQHLTLVLITPAKMVQPVGQSMVHVMSSPVNAHRASLENFVKTVSLILIYFIALCLLLFIFVGVCISTCFCLFHRHLCFQIKIKSSSS